MTQKKTIKVEDILRYIDHLRWLEDTSDGTMQETYREDREAVIIMANQLAGIPISEMLRRGGEAVRPLAYLRKYTDCTISQRELCAF